MSKEKKIPISQTKFDKIVKKSQETFNRAMASGEIWADSTYKKRYKIPKGETFTQIWTDDKTDKYYAVRSQINPIYYASIRGTILSTYGGKVSVLKPVIKDKKDPYSRLFVTLGYYRNMGNGMLEPDKSNLDPCIYTGLVYGADCQEYAKMIFDKFGMDSFRKSVADEMGFSRIQCHHIKPYHHGEFTGSIKAAQAKTRKYMPENCNPDNLLFADISFHGQLTQTRNPIAVEQAKINKEREDALENDLTYMQKTNDILTLHGVDDHITATIFDTHTTPEGRTVVDKADAREFPVNTRVKVSCKPYNLEAKQASAEVQMEDARYFAPLARQAYQYKQEIYTLQSSEDETRLYKVRCQAVAM